MPSASSRSTWSWASSAFLIVLWPAVRQHGAPEVLISDSGGIFLAKEASRIYRALHIKKNQIDRGQAWQSYIETTFNIQRQMGERSRWPSTRWRTSGIRNT